MIASLLLYPALHVTIIGALGGLVGAFAYLDRRIFFAESVTHGTFPGAVLGVVIAAAFGFGHSGMSAALYVGAFLGTIPLVALMRWLATIPGISSQGAAGIVLTAGFASGYFLATWFKPLPLAVNSFLTGSVMTVSPADVAWAAVVFAVALLVVTMGLIAAPAAALAPLVRSSRAFLVGCPLLGAFLGIVGLAIAVPAKLSAGGTIALLCAACVLASRVPQWWAGVKRTRRASAGNQ